MRDLDTKIELTKKLLAGNDVDAGNADVALGVSSPINLGGLGPGLQCLCLLSTMYSSALAFLGMEISLGCLEPAHLILTAALLDMEPMHKTEGYV